MYRAPLREMRFVLEELLDAGSLSASALLADYSDELARSVLEEAARFAETVLDPLNRPGDTHGARWTADGVVTAPGFREAYKQFVVGGWPGLGAEPQFGGQRVPRVLVSAVGEFWGSACLAFKLGPMLTHGAVHALDLCGSAAQKQQYLPRMISGEWTGTMVLTEPQAGSDLGEVRTRAVPDGDHYRLFGQKIFITWGDHDLTANTVHMVLGRIEGAPPGVKGISLFIVPKVLVNADGSLGARNDVRCLSIEHKLGIHASPTCVLAFGEKNGAVGDLVGEPGRGLEYMFVMMNSARLSVGSEGYAVGERAFQRALEWARTRVQGKPPVAQGAGPAPIINHPDVKRMLLTMKATTEAMRSLAYWTSALLDRARKHPDEAERRRAQAMVDLLIPVVKGWSTEMGIEVASLGIQVHGGMGFIEETGAAQHLRDARITTIYEGTTGIQANDLVGRKMGREEGRTALAVLAEIDALLPRLSASDDANLKAIGDALGAAAAKLRDTVQWVAKTYPANPAAVAAGSVYVLKLMGITLGGWMLARGADIASRQLAKGEGDPDFLKSKILTARFFADHVMAQAPSLASATMRGAESVLAVEDALI